MKLHATGSLVRHRGTSADQGREADSRWNRGALSTVDGPFAETKEVIGGFAILDAKSMADALAITRRFLEIHGDEWNLECEVRQIEGPEFGG
jgi:hypothetical protein